MSEKGNPTEKLLWSIALPGFGQLLNGAYLKGFVLIVLEFIINVKSNLNIVIIESFYGNVEKAIQLTNYQWLMFYPCVYLFAIWDAYKDARGVKSSYSAIPFVFSAYFGTIGVIYSRSFLGPIWLPIICLVLGAGIGYIILKVIEKER